MPTSQHIGKGGHLAVMAELANRGYNVALPEIDIGDDIFAVNDIGGAMWRIQVKTGVARVGKKGINTAQFRVRKSAITTAPTPDLHFVFAIRQPDRYRFVVIGRQVLNNYVLADQLGCPSTVKGVDWVHFNLRLLPNGSLMCGNRDLRHHLEDWATWKPI